MTSTRNPFRALLIYVMTYLLLDAMLGLRPRFCVTLLATHLSMPFDDDRAILHSSASDTDLCSQPVGVGWKAGYSSKLPRAHMRLVQTESYDNVGGCQNTLTLRPTGTERWKKSSTCEAVQVLRVPTT